MVESPVFSAVKINFFDIVQFDGVLTIFTGASSLQSALQNERGGIIAREEFLGGKENYEGERNYN